MAATLSEPLDLSIKRHEERVYFAPAVKAPSYGYISSPIYDLTNFDEEKKVIATTMEPIDLRLVALGITASTLTGHWPGTPLKPDGCGSQPVAPYKSRWMTGSSLHCASPDSNRNLETIEMVRRSHSMPETECIPESLDCLLCSSDFKVTKDLYSHMIVHSKQYRCKVCGKPYKQVRTYRAHLATHKSAREFTCDLCNTVLSSSEDYLQHLKKHGRTDLHSCTYCSKYFRDNGTLQAHIRIHTGDRPYRCDICGKAFRQTSTLRRHSKTHSSLYSEPDSS